MGKIEQKYCEKCHKVMRIDNFYKSFDNPDHDDGYLNECKQCRTMHVDNWRPETFTDILQECNVPYIPDEWNKLLASYGKDPKKVTSTTILGRYLAKMQLKQYRDYRWADSQFLQELADHKTEEAMKRAGHSMSEITKVVEENRGITVEEPEWEEEETATENYLDKMYDDGDDDIAADLTEEDRTMLRLKWGKLYKPEEWVQLEQFYQEMLQSYDIVSAGDLNSLKMVCKVSLKVNQLLDIGDIDGAQKAQKMYDSLMKSGKWTAAQNKAESGEFLNSISELVAICEAEGFIPRYYTDEPNDRVDETIRDMKNYTRSLVVEEMNLGNLIENAVKQMAAQEAQEEDEDIEDEEVVFEELEYEDYEEYQDFIDEQKQEDAELVKKMLGEEE